MKRCLAALAFLGACSGHGHPAGSPPQLDASQAPILAGEYDDAARLDIERRVGTPTIVALEAATLRVSLGSSMPTAGDADDQRAPDPWPRVSSQPRELSRSQKKTVLRVLYDAAAGYEDIPPCKCELAYRDNVVLVQTQSEKAGISFSNGTIATRSGTTLRWLRHLKYAEERLRSVLN